VRLGKSSLLNRLVDGVVSDVAATAVARVGKTPGATASVNLYALHDSAKGGDAYRDVLGLCDLPGFGYAKLSKQVQESVQLAAERYLSHRKHLALGVLLVDIRRTPSDDDRAVLAALYDLGIPLLVVATKLDKVASKSQREVCLETIRTGLGLPPNQPLAVSTVSGDGCRDLWRIILEACEGAVQEFGAKYDGGAAAANGDVANARQVESSGDDEMLEFDDDDDIAYSQGYDWIHDGDGGVMYEGDEYDEEE
jgi:GTP-binding protein